MDYNKLSKEELVRRLQTVEDALSEAVEHTREYELNDNPSAGYVLMEESMTKVLKLILEESDEYMLNEFNRTILPKIAVLDMVKCIDMSGNVSPMMNSFMDDISDYPYNTILSSVRKYKEYQKNLSTKDRFVPKLAVLQLREGEENYRKHFRNFDFLKKVGESPNAENYEIVFIEERGDRPFDDPAILALERIYARFNSGEPHPLNYYGHSLSVGDIVVNHQRNMVDCEAFFVDDISFKKLPDDFLSIELWNKICLNMDVRVEHEMKNDIHSFSVEQGLKNLEQLMANDDHNQAISLNYAPIFKMADKRAEMEGSKKPLLGKNNQNEVMRAYLQQQRER